MFLSSPRAQETSVPLLREPEHQEDAHHTTQHSIIPPVCVTGHVAEDVRGDKRAVMTFSITANPGEAMDMFSRRATYTLCNFCNMYVLPIFLLHTLSETEPGAHREVIGTMLGLSLGACIQGKYHGRDLNPHILYEAASNGCCRFSLIPGNAIMYEVSRLLRENAEVRQVTLRVEIHGNFLTDSHSKFVRENIQAWRSMLKASQALQLCRHLLTTQNHSERQQAASSEGGKWKFSPHNLGATCAIFYDQKKPWSLDGAGKPIIAGCVFTYGKHASNLGSCTFPITGKVTRMGIVSLHRVREDLKCMSELPEIFPYHLALDARTRVSGDLARHHAVPECGATGAVNGHYRLAVIKSDCGSRQSVAHLARYICLMSSCKQFCGRELVVSAGVLFQVQQKQHTPHLGVPQFKMLERIHSERHPASTSVRQVEEELQFVFSVVENQSEFMCAVGEVFSAARATSAALNSLVECVIFVEEKAPRSAQQVRGIDAIVPSRRPRHMSGGIDTALPPATGEKVAVITRRYGAQSGHPALHHGGDGQETPLHKTRSDPTLHVSFRTRATSDVANAESGDESRESALSPLRPVAQSKIGIGMQSRCSLRKTEPSPETSVALTEQQSSAWSKFSSVMQRFTGLFVAQHSGLATDADGLAGASEERAPADEMQESELEEYIQPGLQHIMGEGAAHARYAPSQAPEAAAPAMEENAPIGSCMRDICKEFPSSMSCKILIASLLAAAMVAALYVGAIRYMLADTYVVSCDIAIAAGLSCTVVLALIASLVVERLLRNNPETLQELSPVLQAEPGTGQVAGRV
ncbi:hypothetical protein [Anaplasma capra]|uniref:hypothetical protein n=1 Tax=Anaplasma capra TaxID=1562740 RepID=UPI0021D5DA6A|nr:hypothetical protein [Anaplasma capra]MCU7611229.1 hypothetical protein [Anaplasma capra]MCU7612601.1 hypothetical protein [Anaplasma capra]